MALEALADHAAEIVLAVATGKFDAPELAPSIGWGRINYLVTELPPDSPRSLTATWPRSCSSPRRRASFPG
jgi:hypothetical protein